MTMLWTEATAISAQPARLIIEQLVCRYGATCVVDHVDLALNPGDHVALIGGNGSWKSTVLRAIMGFHPISSGTLVLDQQTIHPRTKRANQYRHIAWMPQRQTLGHFPLRVRELLERSGNVRLAIQAAAHLAVDQLMDRPMQTLSGGQIQRIFLARAIGSLGAGAGLLLADEPTAALDFAGQTVVADVLASLPVTMLVVTHDRAVVARCQRVLEMAGGSLRELAV